MPIVTQESVSDAARDLESNGSRASVRKVMSALGGGSPNQIAPLLAQYHASKTVLQKPAIPLDPRIPDLIARQIEDAAANAARAADERAAVAADDLEVVSEASRVLELRIQELLGELDQTRQQMTVQVAELTADRDKEATLAVERQVEITRLHELLAREQAAAEAARIETAKSQLTVDQQARDLETKTDALRTLKDDLDAVREAKDKAEKDLAVAEALRAVADQAVKDEKQKSVDLQKQVDDLRLAKDKVEAELSAQKSNAAAAEAALGEKKSMVEELRGQIAMASAERDRALTDKAELTAERDRIRDAYKSHGEASKRREAELKAEVDGLKDSVATERQGRLQDALDKQLQLGQKTAAAKGKPAAATQ
jgi:colicin import membrane protein